MLGWYVGWVCRCVENGVGKCEVRKCDGMRKCEVRKCNGMGWDEEIEKMCWGERIGWRGVRGVRELVVLRVMR